MIEAQGRLKSGGYGDGIETGDVVFYETQMLPTINARQRLALAGAKGRIARAAIIVDPDNPTNPRDVETLYLKMLQAMTTIYGPPSSQVEEGVFGPGFLADLQDGLLMRNAHGRLGDSILRLSIPRRLDGQARIEAMRVRAAPPVNTNPLGFGFEALS